MYKKQSLPLSALTASRQAVVKPRLHKFPRCASAARHRRCPTTPVRCWTTPRCSRSCSRAFRMA